jgi:hypothetical protein
MKRDTSAPRGARLGAVFVLVYVLVCAVLLVLAFGCRDGFFCGVYALGVMVPSGFLYLHWLSDSVPSPAILQWQVLLPTILTNVLLYYLLGRLVAGLRRR